MAKAKTDFTDYIQAFEDELASFIKRVKDRAKARIEKAKAEVEEVNADFFLVINSSCLIVYVYHAGRTFRA